MEKGKLPGDYVAGFVDGEGCFALNFRRDVRNERKNKPVYFYWDVQFAIVLHEDDKEILDKIRERLDCGVVHIPNKKSSVRYQVTNMSDLLSKIIPFFNKYPLHAKKKKDFELWKEAVLIIDKNRQLMPVVGNVGFQKIEWDKNDFLRLKEIYIEMKEYKSGNRIAKWINKI